MHCTSYLIGDPDGCARCGEAFNVHETITAEPYTARRCPDCEVWVYVADGPFAEGDRTKTLADADHYERHHQPAPVEGAFGFPYFDWNTETVQAVREETPAPAPLTYEDACKRAATDQGLDPITDALTAQGIEHRVAQTGGFCMVVEVPLGDSGAYVGITADGPSPERPCLVCYVSALAAQGEEEDEVIAHDVSMVEMVNVVQAERVIARYDEVVHANQTPTVDTVGQVAACTFGEYGAFGEVLDLTETGDFRWAGVTPGSELDDAVWEHLNLAFGRYQARLREEIRRRPNGAFGDFIIHVADKATTPVGYEAFCEHDGHSFNPSGEELTFSVDGQIWVEHYGYDDAAGEWHECGLFGRLVGSWSS